MGIVAPSILAADFAQLLQECQRVTPYTNWLHVDIMDGHFVPNLTIGPTVVKALRKHLPAAHLDCHLMVSHPEQWVEDFARAGASGFTFHYEAAKDAAGLSKKIKSLGMQVGVSIKPGTAIDVLSDELLRSVDLVLVMTVEPGFGGQPLIRDCLPKISALREKAHNIPFLIEVDGGVTEDNAEEITTLGADILVAGSAIFGAIDPGAVVRRLQRLKQ